MLRPQAFSPRLLDAAPDLRLRVARARPRSGPRASAQEVPGRTAPRMYAPGALRQRAAERSGRARSARASSTSPGRARPDAVGAGTRERGPGSRRPRTGGRRGARPVRRLSIRAMGIPASMPARCRRSMPATRSHIASVIARASAGDGRSPRSGLLSTNVSQSGSAIGSTRRVSRHAPISNAGPVRVLPMRGRFRSASCGGDGRLGAAPWPTSPRARA